MSVYAYFFEAQSIQSYILDSGKLKDTIGASELVDWLCAELVDDVISELDESQLQKVRYSRKAAGVLHMLFDDEKLRDDFAALWPLVVAQVAPGLGFKVGKTSGADDVTSLEMSRTVLLPRLQTELPLTAPVTRRSGRTGNAAVETESNRGGPVQQQLTVDAPSKAKRGFKWPANHRENGSADYPDLLSRFSPQNSFPFNESTISWNQCWPKDLTPGNEDALPFKGEKCNIALVHIDGNGIGQLFRKFAETLDGEELIQKSQCLSENLASVTQDSARHATQSVLGKELKEGQKIAARPIILGGDDVTIIVRADLALLFVTEFVAKFEELGKGVMEQARIDNDKLTAGAGIVYMNVHQPLYMASSLVESLTALAKSRAIPHRPIQQDNKEAASQSTGTGNQTARSVVAFHRVTNSMLEDYQTAIDREKTRIDDDGKKYINTLGVYSFDTQPDLPHINELFDLQRILTPARNEDSSGSNGGSVMGDGAVRQILGLMGHDLSQAKVRYRRWIELMRRDQGEAFRQFCQLVHGCSFDESELDGTFALPYRPIGADSNGSEQTDSASHWVSPLGDVMALIAMDSVVPPASKAVGRLQQGRELSRSKKSTQGQESGVQ